MNVNAKVCLPPAERHVIRPKSGMFCHVKIGIAHPRPSCRWLALLFSSRDPIYRTPLPLWTKGCARHSSFFHVQHACIKI